MLTIYEVEVNDSSIQENLYRIGNQIFKLLPMREENKDWKKPLETLIIELLGMSKLFPDQKNLLSLVCKLEGLKDSDNIDFFLYRRTIFECCGLVDQVKKDYKNYVSSMT